MGFTGERFIPGETDKELEIEHLQRYELLKEWVKDKRVLDAACGEGYGSYVLSLSAKSVQGIDINVVAIENAQTKYSKNNLNFLTGSVDKLPFEDASFDVVVSFETLEHINEDTQKRFMEEVRRVLTAEGTLIISTPNKKFYTDIPNYTNPFHVKELYKEEFLNLLQTYYKVVNLASQRFEVASVIDIYKGETKLYAGVESHVPNYEVFQKYMIAFCSDFEANAQPLASVSLFPEKYLEISLRILNLQAEVIERNEHISTLDQEITFLRSKYHEYEEFIQELMSAHITPLDKPSKAVRDLVAKNNQLEDENKRLIQEEMLYRENETILKNALEKSITRTEEMVMELNNKEGHISLLLQKDIELDNIHSSTGWAVLNKYYKFRDGLAPRNSKRRLMLKLALRTIKHPRLMVSKLNKGNLKKLKYYLENEDASRLENRIDTYMGRHTEMNTEKKDIQIFSNQDYKKITFTKQENPLVSIIIPVYNQWNYTYSCLASIVHNTNDVSYEIIIADDMSTDETININNYIENITVVRDGVNRGFLLNCNNAANYAKGKYLFFLNNDTNVQPNWLSSLVELVQSDASIGMVGSKLVYPDGRLQEAGGIIWNDASGWNYGRLDDPEKAEYNYVKEADYISGAAILVFHDIWKELGGFDERYVPAYFEDTDLAFEVRRLGYKVLLQPKSVIVHFEGVSHGTDTNSGIKSYQVKNKEKFLDKWKTELDRDHFANAENVFWARDRSRNKKTIVVVDHYVPHFDKDAGGRCTHFYLKLFVSMGFHVIFIGDNYFRHEPYTSNLQQLGIEVLYGDYYAKNINKWIKSNASYIDYVYLNRPHISVKYMENFKKNTSAKIIYFGHDLHYLREMRNYELTKNPSLLKSSDDWKEMEFGLFKNADIIHVVGSYEQSILQKELPNHIVRNIPLFTYENAYEQQTDIKPFDERKDLLFVGGFNHTPNYDGIVWFIEEVYPSIKKRLVDVKLYIVGSNPPDDLIAKSSDDIIITGFVSDEELENYYNRCRLVVVPLRYGAGVKGKVVEALYYQIPVVTTSIGAEGLKDPEEVMLVQNQASDFAETVAQIYQDQEEWVNYSLNSGRYIEKYFSVKAAREIIAYDISN